jgi:hypothetical protein
VNKFFEITLTIATMLLLLALAITYSEEAITALRWQVKATTISNILNTPTEAWWTQSPLRIALDVTISDPQNIISALIAAFTWSVRMFVKVR